MAAVTFGATNTEYYPVLKSANGKQLNLNVMNYIKKFNEVADNQNLGMLNRSFRKSVLITQFTSFFESIIQSFSSSPRITETLQTMNLEDYVQGKWHIKFLQFVDEENRDIFKEEARSLIVVLVKIKQIYGNTIFNISANGITMRYLYNALEQSRDQLVDTLYSQSQMMAKYHISIPEIKPVKGQPPYLCDLFNHFNIRLQVIEKLRDSSFDFYSIADEAEKLALEYRLFDLAHKANEQTRWKLKSSIVVAYAKGNTKEFEKAINIALTQANIDRDPKTLNQPYYLLLRISEVQECKNLKSMLHLWRVVSPLPIPKGEEEVNYALGCLINIGYFFFSNNRKDIVREMLLKIFTFTTSSQFPREVEVLSYESGKMAHRGQIRSMLSTLEINDLINLNFVDRYSPFFYLPVYGIFKPSALAVYNPYMRNIEREEFNRRMRERPIEYDYSNINHYISHYNLDELERWERTIIHPVVKQYVKQHVNEKRKREERKNLEDMISSLCSQKKEQEAFVLVKGIKDLEVLKFGYALFLQYQGKGKR